MRQHFINYYWLIMSSNCKQRINYCHWVLEWPGCHYAVLGAHYPSHNWRLQWHANGLIREQCIVENQICRYRQVMVGLAVALVHRQCIPGGAGTHAMHCCVYNTFKLIYNIQIYRIEYRIYTCMWYIVSAYTAYTHIYMHVYILYSWLEWMDRQQEPYERSDACNGISGSLSVVPLSIDKL